MNRRFLQSCFAGLAAAAALGLVTAAPMAQAAGITLIASFPGAPGGANPHSGLTIDSSGNLFGTTNAGGTAGKGTVFEIAQGTNALTTLASFTGTGKNADPNGASPYAGVTLDAAGNLYGTTFSGGSANQGTVWEIAHGTTTLTTVASFTGDNGNGPYGGVTLDGSGNLFGTTLEGGSAGSGTVWEIPAGSSAIVLLATFTEVSPIGGLPWSNVTLDAAGDIFGTTQIGGVGGAGTVWEIPASTGILVTLASFTGTGANGANPIGQLTLDANGNLYGTTNSGGTGSEGTVFEVAQGSGVITTLASFDGGVNGGGPGTMLTMDSGGNLFGTAYAGGAANAGTVWELPHNGALTLLAAFAGGVNGAGPRGAVTFDSQGDMFGITGGSDNYGYGNGAVWEIAAAIAPPVTHAQLLWNNVSGQAALWNLNADGTYTSVAYGPYSGWTARAVSEAPDGADWLLWTNTSGEVSLWRVSALTASGYTTVQYGPYPNFAAVSLSIGSDGNPRLLWNETSGTASLWDINKSSGAFTHAEYGPFAGWTANQVAGGATVTDLLWTNTNGTAAGWRIAADGTLNTSAFGPFANYSAVSLSVGPDDGAHLLWDSTGGSEALWSADFTTGAFSATSYGPISGWATRAIATGPDNGTRLLWDNANGEASLWDVTTSGFTHQEFGPFSGWTAVGVSAGP